MLRPAIEGDAARIDAFLAPMTETSLFLRGNLARHGLFNRDHPHGTAYFLWEEEGAIRAVFGCTNGGFLLCQAPDAPGAFWAALPVALEGRRVLGMTGLAGQVEQTISALKIPQDAIILNNLEPLYVLDFGDLVLPAKADTRPATKDDLPLLERWFSGYIADTEPQFPAGQIAERAGATAQRAVDIADTRLLTEHGTPLAMAAVLSRADDTVQVGAVYVPPSHRGAGRGGAVVAAHMADLRAKEGVQKAVLFAHNPTAARAYERIGFRRIGTARIIRLSSPWKVTPCP